MKFWLKKLVRRAERRAKVRQVEAGMRLMSETMEPASAGCCRWRRAGYTCWKVDRTCRWRLGTCRQSICPPGLRTFPLYRWSGLKVGRQRLQVCLRCVSLEVCRDWPKVCPCNNQTLRSVSLRGFWRKNFCRVWRSMYVVEWKLCERLSGCCLSGCCLSGCCWSGCCLSGCYCGCLRGYCCCCSGGCCYGC